MEKFGVGKKFITKEGCDIEIVEKLDSSKRRIRFLEYNFEIIVSIQHLTIMNIRNPYRKSVYKNGYLGVGEYSSGNKNSHTPEYVVWKEVLRRCYDKDFKDKHPTYKNASVSKYWLNFQNFAKWYEDNYPKNIENVKFELDKDLLQQGVENKIYSPETCIFLPKKINSFLAKNKNNNTSGHTGVSWHKRDKLWSVKINDFISNKCIYLGSFLDINQAMLAYENARNLNVISAKNYLTHLNYLNEEVIDKIN